MEGAKLPLELLDAIVDEISASTRDDPTSKTCLLNCALVCRSMYTRASGHTYSAVSVVSGTERNSEVNQILAKKLEKLHLIFEKNGALAQRVRTFTLDVCFADTILAIDPFKFLNNPHLPLILDQLSSISAFEWISHIRPFPWNAFSLQIRQAISALLQRPSLISMSLCAIQNVPVNLILNNGNLKHLFLKHIDIYNPEDHELPLTLFPCDSLRLASHVSHNSAETVFRLLLSSPYMFSQLRVLRVWMRRSDEVSAAWAVMKSAASALETLDIEDMSHFQCKHIISRYILAEEYCLNLQDPTMIPGPVDIGSLPSLTHFSVNCLIASGDGVVFPMGIYGILNSGSSPSRIEDVKITIDWIDCVPGTELRKFSEEPGWTALDDVLSGAKFSSLQKVSLTLKMGYGWRTTQTSGDNPPQRIIALKDKIQSLVAKLLPQTSRRLNRKVYVNLLIYRSRYALDTE
ncbi:hypothetical protein JR316_0005387 [Psilocybe cubensis]|uniref:Uncharacterized protein n=2 Tax=Psilocybe cubensis TaxID=181762 RepID=A0ACB8H705_PSICU|nr:hypothetical protein JR316_0005387 [Psilocybe cubensis]KAH9483281.1 hypothetical protein JR316_0005387 [Psilocybe cubensis]